MTKNRGRFITALALVWSLALPCAQRARGDSGNALPAGAIAADPVSADGAPAAVQPLRSNEWIRSWMVCGPFPLGPEQSDHAHLPGFETDFLAAHGGEANPEIRSGQAEPFEGGSAVWIHHSAPDSIVDLDRAVGRQEPALAYALAEIESDSGQLMVLALGSNDGGRLWFNNTPVWDRAQGRKVTPDDDLVPVRLRKGLNRILLKIEERGNEWGFCARFVPFDQSALPELFRIVPKSDGGAALEFAAPRAVFEDLFSDLDLELYSERQREAPVWSAPVVLARDNELSLGVNRDFYRRYRLVLTGRLTDGSGFSRELFFSAGRRAEHILFEEGHTRYAIRLGAAASESERWAAEELAHWLERVSGARFPVVSTGPPRDHEIVIGFNRRSRELLGPGTEPPADGDESFTIANIGPALLIWGGRDRGTMYGVFTFLERELGVRWYTPRVTVVAQKNRYSFDSVFHAESPGVRVRNDFYYEAFDPLWAARNKINGAMSWREQPGGVEAYWGVHTFYRFVPPADYFEDHPEYFSQIDGERTWERAQLCLTHPDVLDLVSARLLETMRENPQYLIYSVSQNDWGNPCQCEKCSALARREGSEAGPLIWFVNRVAERVESEFPSKFVGTLAYTYTRKAPLYLRPRHNVVVRLCSIECCFAHDFTSCPENASFLADLRDWAEIAPHLYIWDYVVNFSHYIMPYPNFRVLGPNIRTLAQNNAIGIMEQAAYQSRGGEFAELRAWLIARLLWDPGLDAGRCIDDFVSGYYGRSGPAIRRYFDLLHSRLTPQTHIHIGLSPEDEIFSSGLIRKAGELFREAAAVADGGEILARVEMAELPLLYLKCLRNPSAAKRDGSYRRLKAIVEREEITHFAERGAPHRQAFYRMMEETP